MSSGAATAVITSINLSCKKMLSLCIGIAGRTGMLDHATNWVVFRLAPLLLDERIIPNRAVPRRLRGLRIRALCNPYNPFHRSLYWLGKLHERELDNFLRCVLRPGDHFVDIGANFGHMSALAAGLVGSDGSVTAFEPHPDLARMVHEFLRAEVGHWVTVHPVALGDTPRSVTLRVQGDALSRSNVGQFGDDETAESHGFMQAITVPQVRADGLLNSLPELGIVVAKIDVEGHEPAVLRGMQEVLRSRVDAVVVEVTPEWIGGASGVKAMFQQMQELSFEAWMMDSGVREKLWCRCQPADIAGQTNVLFAKRSMLISRGLLAAEHAKFGPGMSTKKLRVRV